MKISTSLAACILIIGVFLLVSSSLAQDLKSYTLPTPDTVGGKPLMQVLKERKSSRSFSDEQLPPQILSNLLWAAFGINRPDGHRTAPSARNWQEIDIYVTTKFGVYLYDAKKHALDLILAGDHREIAGTQDFVKEASINLIYVADLSKMSKVNESEKDLYMGADCGFIAQNVYLYCASEGLACVVRASINREECSEVLKLRPDQRVVLSQTVGQQKK